MNRRADALQPHAVDYLEGLLEGFVAYDGDWVMTYMNAAGERILNRRREDVLGRTWHEAFPHAVGNPVDAMYQRVMRTRQPERMEYFYPHYGRWLEISAAPVRSGGVGVYFRDITERAALNRSEERYRRIFQTTGVSIWEEDFSAVKGEIDRLQASGVRDLRAHFREHPDFVRRAIAMVKVIDVNETTLRMFGAKDKSELLASLGSIFVPETEAVFAEELVAIAEGRERFGSDAVLRTLQGEPRHVFLTIAFPPTRAGFESVLVTLMDISERKSAEDALRESEARKRLMFETALDCIISIDQEDRVVEFNPAAERTFGYRRAEVLGRKLAELIVPFRLREQHRQGMARYLATGEHRVLDRRLEMPAMRADGSEFPAELTVTRIPGDAATLFTAYLRDITERRRAEEALREADRRKDEFLAMLAHELRNPLAPIRNALYLLRVDGGAGPVAAEAREVMERQLSQLVRLVDDLLEVSRISRGKIELRRAAVDLADVVASAVETSRPAIDGARHRLEVQLPPAPLHVDGDFVRLSQVIANLLNNAAKYTDPGGRITVSVAREGGEAAIRVRDNGVGLAPELVPHIFNMFAQADRARAAGGLGIGLALAKMLVDLHGGRIDAKSDGPGQGSEFSVRLPLAL